jgi:CRISPR-associated protein Csm1
MQQDKFRLIVAALLHDVGKALERSDNTDAEKVRDRAAKLGVKYSHAWYTDEFFEKNGVNWPKINFNEGGENSIRLLARNHHNPKSGTMQEIIQKADRASAGERRPGGSKEEIEGRLIKKTLLRTVFDRLELFQAPTGGMNYYLPGLPSEKSAGYGYPTLKSQDKDLTGDYKMLMDSLVEEIKKIDSFAGEHTRYLNHLSSILEKHFGLITDSASEGQQHDVTLFDHSRITAAISGCLFDRQKEKSGEELLLIAADMNGIQKFIYRIAESQGQGSIAKRLRSRSYLVALITERCGHLLCRKLDMPWLNLLYCGGGGFHLLAANTPATTKIVEETEKELQQWLYDQFEGDLSLNMTALPVSLDRFGGDYSSVLTEISEGLNASKNRKFSRLVSGRSFFVDSSDKTVKHACLSCGILMPESGGDECKWCQKQKNMGTDLPNAKSVDYLVKADGSNKDSLDLGILGGLNINAEKQNISSGVEFTKNYSSDAIWVVPRAVLNAKIESEKASDNPDGLVNKGQVLSFKTIAACSIGDPKIGVLRMDVDNLGLLFGLGFDQDDKTASRLATLSRLLDAFFTRELAGILAERFGEWQKNPHAPSGLVQILDQIFYLSYAGGDDLFIVGPASEMPYLAANIRRRFGEYTGNNPNISISGGLVIVGPSEPIAVAAEMAEKMLLRAKKNDKTPEIKDRINCFNTTVDWEMYGELIKMGVRWAEWIRDKKLPRSFIHGLIRRYHKYVDDKGNVDPSYYPQLKYQMVRNIKNEKVYKTLHEELITSTEAIKLLGNIMVPASYALMITRNNR